MASFAHELLGDREPSVSPPCPQLHPLENGSCGTFPSLGRAGQELQQPWVS